jgi:hypothetical protein
VQQAHAAAEISEGKLLGLLRISRLQGDKTRVFTERSGRTQLTGTLSVHSDGA